MESQNPNLSENELEMPAKLDAVLLELSQTDESGMLHPAQTAREGGADEQLIAHHAANITDVIRKREEGEIDEVDQELLDNSRRELWRLQGEHNNPPQ